MISTNKFILLIIYSRCSISYCQGIPIFQHECIVIFHIPFNAIVIVSSCYI